MLEHRFRFHGHNSLRFVYRQGRVARTPNMTLRYIDNPGRVHSRVAIIIAKKVVKSAPKRNRIRRRLYEAVRLHPSLLPAGYDLVLTVISAEPLILPFDELKREVDSLGRAARIKKKPESGGAT